MRKNVFGRRFKRDANERKALFKGLIHSWILDESIKTTLEKAKAIKGDVDKIVNKAKKGEKEALYLLQPILSPDALKKMINDIAPRVSDRNSGYTKLTKLGRRFSDNAAMVLMEWVVKEVKNEKLKVKSEEKTGFKKAEALEIPAEIDTKKGTKKDKIERKKVKK